MLNPQQLPLRLYQTILADEARIAIDNQKPKALDLDRLSITDLHNVIRFLRSKNFDYQIEDQGQIYLIKDCRGKKDAELDPIDPNEALIQALRYSAGMLLIAEQTENNTRLLQDIKAAIKAYDQLPVATQIANTKRLIATFAHIIDKHLPGGNAFEQINMAKDLALMLETPTSVCTLSNDMSGKLSIEIASPIRISAAFYSEEMSIHNAWFQAALVRSGLDKQPTNWLSEFVKKCNVNLARHGMCAPPSARWLPLPGNIQNVMVYTTTEAQPCDGYYTEFTRFGTPSCFEIKNLAEQNRLAQRQLQEIVNQKLLAAWQSFREKYRPFVNDRILSNCEFQFDYLQLLSPIRGMQYLYPWAVVDNNAAFVNMAKAQMQNLHIPAGLPDKLSFNHTNAPINSWATTSRHYDQDKTTRLHKIAITYDLLAHIFAAEHLNIQLPINDDLQLQTAITQIEQHANFLAYPAMIAELSMRLQAAFYLKQLLENQAPFKQLSNYQKNLMMVGLEFHVMGAQACSIAGCKSARDRTAVFAAAIKIMQENTRALHDWKTLNMGILRSLKEGQHFRAMMYHTAIVKLADVHEHYAEISKKSVKELKVFTKYIHHDQKPLLTSACETKPESTVDLFALQHEVIQYQSLLTGLDAIRQDLKSLSKNCNELIRIYNSVNQQPNNSPTPTFFANREQVLSQQSSEQVSANPSASSIAKEYK